MRRTLQALGCYGSGGTACHATARQSYVGLRLGCDTESSGMLHACKASRLRRSRRREDRPGPVGMLLADPAGVHLKGLLRFLRSPSRLMTRFDACKFLMLVLAAFSR